MDNSQKKHFLNKINSIDFQQKIQQKEQINLSKKSIVGQTKSSLDIDSLIPRKKSNMIFINAPIPTFLSRIQESNLAFTNYSTQTDFKTNESRMLQHKQLFNSDQQRYLNNQTSKISSQFHLTQGGFNSKKTRNQIELITTIFENSSYSKDNQSFRSKNNFSPKQAEQEKIIKQVQSSFNSIDFSKVQQARSELNSTMFGFRQKKQFTTSLHTPQSHTPSLPQQQRLPFLNMSLNHKPIDIQCKLQNIQKQRQSMVSSVVKSPHLTQQIIQRQLCSLEPKKTYRVITSNQSNQRYQKTYETQESESKSDDEQKFIENDNFTNKSYLNINEKGYLINRTVAETIEFADQLIQERTKQEIKDSEYNNSPLKLIKQSESQKKLFKKDRKIKICSVEKNSLNFLINLFNLEGRDQENLNQLIMNINFISCSEHSNQEDDSINSKVCFMLQNFYKELSLHKISKIATEKQCHNFLVNLLQSKELQFKHLRQQLIQQGGINQRNSENQLRSLNPQIFLQKNEINVKDPNEQLEAVTDPQQHHQLSFNPNRKLVTSRGIMEGFIKNLVESEMSQTLGIDYKKSSPYKPQRLKSIQNKQFSFNKNNLSDLALKMNEGLLKSLRQRVSDFQHFQSSMKSDLAQKVQITGAQKRIAVDLLAQAERDEIKETITSETSSESDKTSENYQAKQEVFGIQQSKFRFFKEQKDYIKNQAKPPTATNKFSQALELNNQLALPIFAEIQGGVLCLQNRLISEDTIFATMGLLQEWTQQILKGNHLRHDKVLIEELIIDDCAFKDNQFALFLEGITQQGQLSKLDYIHGEFGAKSLKALINLIFQRPRYNQFKPKYNGEFQRNPVLQYLNLSYLKCDQAITEQLFDFLEETIYKDPISSLKLSGLYLNNSKIIQQIINQLSFNKYLIKFDISYSKILPQQLANILNQYAQIISENPESQSLQYLSIAYISIDSKIKNQENCQQNFVNSVAKIIQFSKSLMHLDLSGLNLSDRIIPLMEKIKESKTVIAVHLNDNNFSLALQTQILELMKIQVNKFHIFKALDNLQEQNQFEQLSQKYKKYILIQTKIHEFFKKESAGKNMQLSDIKKVVQMDIINSQIHNQIKYDQNQIKSQLTRGITRQNTTKQPFLLTRKLGQPELIFNELPYCFEEFSTANSDESWSFYCSQYDDDCYCCKQHSYLQLFFNREKAHLDFQKVTNYEQINLLKELYEIDSNDGLKFGSPVLLSSINNWILTRLIDVKLFAQLLKGENEKFIKQSIQKQQDQYVQQLNESKRRIQTDSLFKKTSKQLNDGLQNMIPSAALKQYHLQQKQLNDIQERIQQISDGKKFYQQELQLTKQRSNTIKQTVRQTSNGYNVLLGIDNLNIAESIYTDTISSEQDQQNLKKKRLLRRKKTTEFLDNQKFDVQMVDSVAAREWRDIVNKCQIYRQDIVSINFPPLNIQSAHEQIQIFSGFVKPGRHVIFIYDPKSKMFYRKDIVVEVRKGPIKFQQAKNIDIQENKVQEMKKKQPSIFDNPEFIFQKWRQDDNDLVLNLVKLDLQNKKFTSITTEMPSQLFISVRDRLPTVYPLILRAYKTFITRSNFPEPSFDLFIDFLIELDIVRENKYDTLTSTHNTPSVSEEDDCQSPTRKANMINKNKVLNLLEQDQTQIEELVDRSHFFRRILQITYQNYLNHNNSRISFLDFFAETTLSSLEAYVKRFGKGMTAFREKIIWTEDVSDVLNANKLLLQRVYNNYKMSGKFTLKSAFNLIKDLEIDMTIKGHNQDKEGTIRLIFGASKQTVVEQPEFYHYQSLEEIEFLEFIARLAEHVFHPLRVEGDEENEPSAILLQNLQSQVSKQKITKTKEQKERELFINTVNDTLDVKIYQFLLQKAMKVAKEEVKESTNLMKKLSSVLLNKVKKGSVLQETKIGSALLALKEMKGIQQETKSDPQFMSPNVGAGLDYIHSSDSD